MVGEGDLELLHGIEDDAEGSEDVVEYDGAPFFLFALGEALGIDEAHLLENSRFATLAGTWKTHAIVSRGTYEVTEVRASGLMGSGFGIGIGGWELTIGNAHLVTAA